MPKKKRNVGRLCPVASEQGGKQRNGTAAAAEPETELGGGEIEVSHVFSMTAPPAVSTNKQMWNQGRRIVELGVLAEGLVCEDCSLTLSLINTAEETKLGLGSPLYIFCECGLLNSVATGKTHRRPGATKGVPIFDINSKAATGEHTLVLIYSKQQN